MNPLRSLLSCSTGFRTNERAKDSNRVPHGQPNKGRRVLTIAVTTRPAMHGDAWRMVGPCNVPCVQTCHCAGLLSWRKPATGPFEASSSMRHGMALEILEFPFNLMKDDEG